MTELERKLAQEIVLRAISQDEFLSRVAIKEEEVEGYVLNLLEAAYKDKNANDVEYALIIIFFFNIYTKRFTGLLCKILPEKWHYKHEDIVRLFQTIKEPDSIECLYNTAITYYDYLEYNDCSALIRKCCWALGDINSAEAREKLDLLAQSENEIVREAVKEQLARDIWD